MIYWYGKYYTLITSPYNGSVLGYLLDGILLHSRPKGTKVRGYITTEDGVVIVLGRDRGWKMVCCTVMWSTRQILM